MFQHLQNQQKNETQADIDAATLRTMIDLNVVCDPESILMTGRRPFRLATREGSWTGAFLPDVMGAVAVRCELNGNVISTNSRLGCDLSWSLNQAGVYARLSGNLNEWQGQLRESQENDEPLRYNGWRYHAAPILRIIRALGAPDPRFERGHFTYQEPVCGVENPQVLALSGTVARVPWRAFVLPVVNRLEFLDRREGTLGEI